jgi:hypothetical protein
MNQASVHKKFIFNEKIDQDYLYSLYEEDYHYIAEVFSSSLECFNEELQSFSNAFESSDIPALKKAAHKLKPLFGFTGLLHQQEMMARFEHACMTASNAGNLTMQYIELMEVIKEGKNILQEDYNRLTVFTS